MTNLGGLATTNGTVFLTIPANKTWRGQVNLSATVAVAAAGAAVNASAKITLAGTGCDPISGDYLHLNLHAPASVLGAVGTSDSGNTHMPMTIHAGSTPVTLTLNTTNTTMQSASAFGVLL